MYGTNPARSSTYSVVATPAPSLPSSAVSVTVGFTYHPLTGGGASDAVVSGGVVSTSPQLAKALMSPGAFGNVSCCLPVPSALITNSCQSPGPVIASVKTICWPSGDHVGV